MEPNIERLAVPGMSPMEFKAPAEYIYAVVARDNQKREGIITVGREIVGITLMTPMVFSDFTLIQAMEPIIGRLQKEVVKENKTVHLMKYSKREELRAF